MGRCDKKIKEKQKKKNKQNKRIKKIMVFSVILLFFVGLSVVDNAYSDMTGNESNIQLEFKRINKEVLEISILGQSIDINTYLISLKTQTLLEEADINSQKMVTYVRSIIYKKLNKQKELPLDAEIL